MPSSSAGCASSLWERGEWTSTVVPGKEDGGRQVLRLLQRHRAGEERAVAPRAGAAARAQGRRPAPRRRAAGRRRRRRPDRARAPHRRRSAGIEQTGPAGRRLARRDGALDLEGQAARRTSSSTSSSGCASRPRPKRSACSAATCTICCSPRRPASASTMGLDPGIRTGVKVAVVDGTGKLLDTATVYPHEPRKDWEGALRTLARARARATACSSSRSATAPRRARPTSSPAI